jgi:hypothetical protein
MPAVTRVVLTGRDLTEGIHLVAAHGADAVLVLQELRLRAVADGDEAAAARFERIGRWVAGAPAAAGDPGHPFTAMPR